MPPDSRWCGGGTTAPVPTRRRLELELELEQNVCNKLSHFCRRPSKYQTWLMAEEQKEQRTANGEKRKYPARKKHK